MGIITIIIVYLNIVIPPNIETSIITFFSALSFSVSQRTLSLFVVYSPFLLDYNRIIFLIVTLDDSIDLTRNSPAFGCTKHTHTNYNYHHRRRCRCRCYRRRRRHSSPILLLSNKFAIKWRLRRSTVEATSAAVAKNGGKTLSNWLFVVQQKMKVVCGRFLLLLQVKKQIH